MLTIYRSYNADQSICWYTVKFLKKGSAAAKTLRIFGGPDAQTKARQFCAKGVK